ncbi:MAG: thioredoxin-dependent thiol peroxidase [Pirellulales bacterium]
MSTWLKPGKQIPDLTLESDDAGPVRLRDLASKPLVVYFYPKDDTPGCTREACAFRDRSAELKKLGAAVLGVSPDSVKSHGKFRTKYSLNFPLLADPNHAAAEAFGAWQEKSMYGRKYMGIQRSTFLFDAAGKLVQVWEKVSVDGHDAEVIAALGNLGTGGASAPTKTKAKPKKTTTTKSKTTTAKKVAAPKKAAGSRAKKK